MATNLPTDIDATYPDASPGDATHQQHHDAIHAYTNTHDAATDPHGDRAYADGLVAALGDAARVYASANQSIPTGTHTALVFDFEVFDDAGYHDTATNNTRLTVAEAGTYVITGQVEFTGNSTGARMVSVPINGSGSRLAQVLVSSAGAVPTRIQATTGPVKLAAGDYVELLAWQDSGAGLNVTAGRYNSWFTLTRVA